MRSTVASQNVRIADHNLIDKKFSALPHLQHMLDTLCYFGFLARNIVLLLFVGWLPESQIKGLRARKAVPKTAVSRPIKKNLPSHRILRLVDSQPFWEVAFSGTAFLGTAFLGTAFLGTAFLGTAFLG